MMGDKKKILYKCSFKTCIVMLIVCIIFKLFGVEWFDINTNISILKNLDNIIMNSYLCSLLYSSILLSINLAFIISIVLNIELNKGFKKSFMFLPFTLFFIVLKATINSNSILFILDFIYIFFICKVLDKHVKFKIIVGVILINILYQFISCFLRDIGFHNGRYGCLVSLIMSLDYYIMLTITYLMKGELLCRISQVSFSSLATKLWKKHLENYSKNKGEN